MVLTIKGKYKVLKKENDMCLSFKYLVFWCRDQEGALKLTLLKVVEQFEIKKLTTRLITDHFNSCWKDLQKITINYHIIITSRKGIMA